MVTIPYRAARLRLAWGSVDAADAFVQSLGAFLKGAGATAGTDERMYGFGEQCWRVEPTEAAPVVHVELPVVDDWQPSPDEGILHVEPEGDAVLPVLTIFGDPGCPSTATLHNLVALGLAAGPLESALLETPYPVRWTTTGPGVPLSPSVHAGCVGPGSARPILFAHGLPQDERAAPVLVGEMAREAAAAHPGVLVRLVPTPTEVRIELAPDLDPEDHALALAHARAHVRLGHVVPGDSTPHVDTRASIVSPQNRWDRLVHDTDPDFFGGGRPESLDACTPREVALLGLWNLIGGMLGGTKPLATRARGYQAAAYQRQAAERLVAQLDALGGAMLCDGVGLGKTYVATTVIVHYASLWHEEHPAEAFRVTVLAPGSVVSTWEREALPPLSNHGVPSAWVRVVSHSKLSQLRKNSSILEPPEVGEYSDFEHLVLSDLVVIDEAHNFRSEGAARTQVLRDLLAIQHRKGVRRKVLLLTATPINNRLADLEQELSLLFGEPRNLSDAKGAAAFRSNTVTELRDRVRRARGTPNPKTNVAPLLVHGTLKGTFGTSPRFDGDIELGPGIKPLAKYLRREEQRLLEHQVAVRARVEGRQTEIVEPVRIAEALLDRVVVQRSRALCKRIEAQEGKDDLLFRRDPDPPERLRYADAYNETVNVLARSLTLFPADGETAEGLSFKVYMWRDVANGFKDADDAAPAVGLQKILALKRLESSPVSFLISLLRLTVLHAERLRQLDDLCAEAGLNRRAGTLRAELSNLLEGRADEDLQLLRWLCVGETADTPASGFFDALRRAAGPEEDEEETERQLGFFDVDDAEVEPDAREKIDRLWPLKDILLRDLRLLLDAAPELARIVFGAFDPDAWPARFLAVADARRWPDGEAWGRRVLTDAKLAALLRRLLQARSEGRKVVVFSQFKDTIAYVSSVLRATARLDEMTRDAVERELGPGLDALLAVTEAITGDTEDRDTVIDRFAPFYRIGPTRPPPDPGRLPGLPTPWEEAWKAAIRKPIHVLFATDVLAEGVNLQDAALLVNYDIHWNPVRMIQRSGRIDRRLNATIERARSFPDVEAIAAAIGLDAPTYTWHGREAEAPVTVNLILPDKLEASLKLRERIAAKTLAIDVTLGLDRGTGAEADWMDAYTYQGVASLSAYERDRAIEELAGIQKELERRLRDRGVDLSWAADLGHWLREEGVGDDGAVVSHARIGRQDRDPTAFSRWLEPLVVDGVPHWLVRGADADHQLWLRLKGDWIATEVSTANLPAADSASSPLLPAHVAPVARRLLQNDLRLAPHEGGIALWQGLAALCDGRYHTPGDRAELAGDSYFLLQVRSPAC